MLSRTLSSIKTNDLKSDDIKNDFIDSLSERNCQRCNFLLQMSLCKDDDVSVQNSVQNSRLYRINLQKPFDDWRDLIVQWWNQFIDFGFSKNFPALYLFGSTYSGKTHFLRDVILKDINELNIYAPMQTGTDQAWVSWNEGHLVGLVEEFKLKVLGKRNIERLSDLIAGRGFFVPVMLKNEQIFIKGKIPLIYTSNLSLEDTNGKVDIALASKFLQINSNGKSYKPKISASEGVYHHLFKEEVFLILYFLKYQCYCICQLKIII
jgi:hypothetical protein